MDAADVLEHALREVESLLSTEQTPRALALYLAQVKREDLMAVGPPTLETRSRQSRAATNDPARAEPRESQGCMRRLASSKP
jgi:hypothetical protein